MKKTILLVLLLSLAANVFAESFYYLYVDNTNKTTLVSESPFDYQNIPYIVRLTDFQATPQIETIDNTVLKPNWVWTAQNLYTNGLTQVGLPNVWTNMAYNYEAVASAILQAIASQLAIGNIEQANLLSTWKGLIKDAYESLNMYGCTYNITDMRLFPYDSIYIYSNTVQRYYIEYNGDKYYLRGE